MPNIYVNQLAVPRVARNERIYAGVSYRFGSSYNTQETNPDRHWEIRALYLTAADPRTEVIQFREAFRGIPIMVDLKAYRIVQMGSIFVKQDVLWYFPTADWLTNTGFQIAIDPTEPMDGVVVTFAFTE